MATTWPGLPYDEWRATCDTLHAHTQVLGKLAVVLAPPEPQLQHAAPRLTARGWETGVLPAPDGSGALVVTPDLRAHEALAEHSDGRTSRVALTPDRSTGAVTRELLAAIGELAGPVAIDTTPQEVPWSVALDEDEEHHTYDTTHVATYFAAATRAALVADLGEFVLDWDDVRASSDPHAFALEFARSAFRHSCVVCQWDPALAASADGMPPPVA